jgi:hypothetical protein
MQTSPPHRAIATFWGQCSVKKGSGAKFKSPVSSRSALSQSLEGSVGPQIDHKSWWSTDWYVRRSAARSRWCRPNSCRRERRERSMKDQPKKYASRDGSCMIRFSLVVRRVEGLLESQFRSLYLPPIQNTRKRIEQYEDEFPPGLDARSIGNLHCWLSFRLRGDE